MNQPHTLYTNAAQTQYYLIPAGADLAAGDFVICAATGEERVVEETEITAFEIDEAAAEAYIKEQLSTGVDQAKLALAQVRTKQKTKAGPEIHKAEQAVQAAKSLLGAATDDLRRSSKLFAESARHFVIGLQTLLESISIDDPAAHKAARMQMRGLQEKLEEAGLNPGVDMETLSDKLRAAYLDQDREQRSQDAADREEVGSRE